MTTETRVLNIRQAVNLATVIGWAQRNAHLRWLTDNGDIASGTARSIGDENGNFATTHDDVRDCHLRITTDAGMEWFVDVEQVCDWIDEGTMVED